MTEYFAECYRASGRPTGWITTEDSPDSMFLGEFENDCQAVAEFERLTHTDDRGFLQWLTI